MSLKIHNLIGEKFSLEFVVSIFILFFLLFYISNKSDPTPVQPEPEPVQIEESVPVPVSVSEKEFSERDVECLALNSYYESRNQSLAGQIAVAQVVLNRVKSPRYPNTICEVIQQGPTYINWKGNELPVRDQCHFSWWCDGKSDIPEDIVTYQKVLDTVTELLYTSTVDITEGSTHYHADYVEPDWSKVFEKTVVIDDHIFYRDSK